MEWSQHHQRDDARVRAETWPHRWTVPAPNWRPDHSLDVAPRHPLDVPVERVTDARRRRRQLDAYAAQAGLYADGLRPDLVIFDELASQEPGYARAGDDFHRLMEALGAHRRRR
jgi:hypothetical protein